MNELKETYDAYSEFSQKWRCLETEDQLVLVPYLLQLRGQWQKALEKKLPYIIAKAFRRLHLYPLCTTQMMLYKNERKQLKNNKNKKPFHSPENLDIP